MCYNDGTIANPPINKTPKRRNTMKTTKAYAKHVLNLWKDETNYFNGTMTEGEFESMLRYRFGFGQAETIVITMALVMAGAKFANN